MTFSFADTPEDLLKLAHDRLVGYGWEPHQAAGIVGNLYHESRGNPLAVGDQGASFGLAQWNKDRLNGLHQFAQAQGVDPRDFETQIDYINHELNTSESQAGQALRQARTPQEATQVFSNMYERPGIVAMGSRMSGTNKLLSLLGWPTEAEAGQGRYSFVDEEPQQGSGYQVMSAMSQDKTYQPAGRYSFVDEEPIASKPTDLEEAVMTGAPEAAYVRERIPFEEIPTGAKLGLINLAERAARQEPAAAQAAMGYMPTEPTETTGPQRVKESTEALTRELFAGKLPEEAKTFEGSIIRGISSMWPDLMAFTAMGPAGAPTAFGYWGATEEEPIQGAAKGAALGKGLSFMHQMAGKLADPVAQWTSRIIGAAGLGGGVAAAEGGNAEDIGRQAALFAAFEVFGMPRETPRAVQRAVETKTITPEAITEARQMTYRTGPTPQAGAMMGERYAETPPQFPEVRKGQEPGPAVAPAEAEGRGGYNVEVLPPTPEVQPRRIAERPAGVGQAEVPQEGVVVAPTPAAKEPWEMTRKEYIPLLLDNKIEAPPYVLTAGRRVGQVIDPHFAVVRDAIKAGRPVPPEVLKDYPDLAKVKPENITQELTDLFKRVKITDTGKTINAGGVWNPDVQPIWEIKYKGKKFEQTASDIEQAKDYAVTRFLPEQWSQYRDAKYGKITPEPEGGETKLYSGGPEYADILKTAAPAIEAAKEVKTGFLSGLLPTARGPEYLRAGEVKGSSLGTMKRNTAIAARLLKSDSRMFDKMGVHNADIPLTENPGPIFASNMSMGRPMEPKMQKVADRVNRLFGDAVKELEEVGVPLEHVRQYYFPGMWEEKGPAESYLSRRPFMGKESFRKPKTFDDWMEGIEAGFTPVSNNPIDLVKLKLSEINRFIMANRDLRKWEGTGDIINVDNSGRPMKKALQADFNPAEWVKIDDKYGTIWTRDPESGLPMKVGYRVAKEPVANIINNYLSNTLYNDPYVGKAFRGVMAVGNSLNQTQLGVFSMFHGGFVASEAQVSMGAEVLKDIYGAVRGNRSIGQLGKSLAKYPLGMGKIGWEGSKILSEWDIPKMDVSVDTPIQNLDSSPQGRVAQIAKAAELAGGGFKLEQGLRTYQTEAMIRDWYGGKKLKAALRSPIALTELGSKPIMEWLVPRMKAGVFGEIAGRIIEQNPEKTLNDLIPEFRQAWNRTDSRLGQVQYDRVFTRNVAKNIIQAIIRAPGWTGGTIAEIGGSIKDVGTFVKEWVKTGKAPENLPDRVAYTLSLAFTVGILNGIMTWVLTGEKPKDIMDLLAFRDGGVDQYGNPTRWLFPTYAKDVYAWLRSPGHTALAKTHPMISVIGELIRGTDYYRTQIRDPESGVFQQAKDSIEHYLKAYEPFWIRGARKATETGGGWGQVLTTEPQKVLAPLVGVMPATRAYTQSKAQEVIDRYHQMNFGKTFTKEEAALNKVRRDVSSLVRQNKIDEAVELVRPIVEENKIDIKKVVGWMVNSAKYHPKEVSFRRLPLDWGLKALMKATPEEQAMWEPIMIEKITKAKPEILLKNMPLIEKYLEQRGAQ